jgi:hypothetical protein
MTAVKVTAHGPHGWVVDVATRLVTRRICTDCPSAKPLEAAQITPEAWPGGRTLGVSRR